MTLEGMLESYYTETWKKDPVLKDHVNIYKFTYEDKTNKELIMELGDLATKMTAIIDLMNDRVKEGA